jgi:hypothetical protein
MTDKLVAVFEGRRALSFDEFVAFLSVERRRERSWLARLAYYYVRQAFWLAPTLTLLLLAAPAFVAGDPARGYYIFGAVAIGFGASQIFSVVWRRHYDRIADNTLTLIVTEEGMEQLWCGCRWSASWRFIDFAECNKGAVVAMAGSEALFFMPTAGFASGDQAQACLDFVKEKINVARSSLR